MTRQCGECQLCCRLLPVRAVHKPASQRCQYQRFGVGCTIYRELHVRSPECRLWSCAWLGGSAGDIGRPDRSHIVIDILPDFVTVTETKQTVPAIQVWIDPNYPEAHRNPALRAYLQQCGQERGECAIIRYSSSDGFVLFPPALTGAGWVEKHGPFSERTHLMAEVVEAAAKRARS